MVPQSVADTFCNELILAEKVNAHRQELIEQLERRIELLQEDLRSVTKDRDKWKEKVLYVRTMPRLGESRVSVAFDVDARIIDLDGPEAFKSAMRELSYIACRQILDFALGGKK